MLEARHGASSCRINGFGEHRLKMNKPRCHYARLRRTERTWNPLDAVVPVLPDPAAPQRIGARISWYSGGMPFHSFEALRTLDSARRKNIVRVPAGSFRATNNQSFCGSCSAPSPAVTECFQAFFPSETASFNAGEFHYIGKEASTRWAGGPDMSMLAEAGALDPADETCREYERVVDVRYLADILAGDNDHLGWGDDERDQKRRPGGRLLFVRKTGCYFPPPASATSVPSSLVSASFQADSNCWRTKNSSWVRP